VLLPLPFAKLVCEVSEVVPWQWVLPVKAEDDVEEEIAEAGDLGYGDIRKAEWLSQDGVRGFGERMDLSGGRAG